MRYLKNLLFLVILIISFTVHAQINDKKDINLSKTKTEKVNGYDRIISDIEYKTNEIGNPELPVYRVSYVLPLDAKVKGVGFRNKKKQKWQNSFDILPVQEPIPTDYIKTVKFTEPNKSVYLSDTPYPNKLYDIESDEFYMGYHIVTLRIYPFEYIPKHKILNYYPTLEFSIEYTTVGDTDEIKPKTQNIRRAEQCKSMVKSLVKNPDDVDKFGSNALTLCNGRNVIQNSSNSTKTKGIQKVKTLSILEEITPDYIIITNNSLKSSFQVLADWKTKKGVFTIIKTTEDIDANYSGSDLQEKIRNYLIESYSKWGAGLYILLGGDQSIVPARMVYGYDNLLQATDMYFSTYSGNWNTDNDNIFKESGEVTTWSMGVVLGRVPVANQIDASSYITKVISYEKALYTNPADLNYLKNNLYADAYIGKADNGSYLYSFGESEIKNYCSTYVPSTIINKYICDNAACTGDSIRYLSHIYPHVCPGGDIELNRANFLNALNTGGSLGLGKFHFIYHMDHGSSQGIATSGIDKGQGVTKTDMGILNNGNSYQILMSGSCHSANFTEDCVAKYYLTNPNGGGVAWIGNTDVGYASEYQQLQYFSDALYSTPNHPSLSRYDIGSAYQNIIKKAYSTNWRLHLLGDPEMQVWTDIPQTLNVTTNSTAILLGEQQLGITISNIPLGQKAYICIQKDTEVYTTQEVSVNGTYYIPFTVNTIGAISVTVTSHNFFPFETTIYANQSTDPNLSVSSVDFGDGIVQSLGVGNANEQNDAGETINLTLGVKNTGVYIANGVTATLSCNSPFICINSSQGSFGNIASGVTATSNQFNYTIRKDAPGRDNNGIVRSECLANDPNPVTFTVTIKDAADTVWTHNYNIDLFKDSLIQCNKTIVSTTNNDLIPEVGEDITMHIALQNIGKAPYRGYRAVLTSTDTAYCTINSGNSNYPAIAPIAIQNDSASFSFHTTTSELYRMTFNLEVENKYGKKWNFPFTLQLADTVGGKNFSASETEINLTWLALNGIGGYNIYRCDFDTINKIPVGNYIKLNSTPFQFSYYIDKGLSNLTRYCYKIATVSTTGMESFTNPFIAWTSYPQINLFPVQMDASVTWISTPFNTADINGDGKKEIFAASNTRIIALDDYGKELNDIDNNITTYSGFARINKVANGIPCIADIYRNGKLHIIEPTRSTTSPISDSIYCFSFEGDKNNDLDWKFGIIGPAYRGAIAANIDNSSDGSMEIITTPAENGTINIYNNTGGLTNTLTPGDCTYGAIAVADLDGNGKKEIIKAYNQGIYIWNSDGSNYKGSNPYYEKPNDGYNFKSSVIVCDLDGDGKKEILTSALKSTGAEGKIYAIRADTITSQRLMYGWGTNANTIPYDNAWHSQEVSVGDLNNDGNLEVVAMSQYLVKIWDNAGNLIRTIQVNSDIPVGKVTPILADVDNNHNDVEIIIGNGSKGTYAFKYDGSPVIGFPLTASGGYTTTLSVADVDNDGKNEIIGSGGNGKVSVWKTDGIPSKIEWGSERHDQYNTGEYYKICEPTIITTDATWNTNQDICGDLIVKSGTLTINNGSDISLGSSSMIIVMSGATLVIDAANVLNANIRALAGSTLIIKNNGKIVLRSNAEFYTEVGTNLEILYGNIER